jgi:hypothetical protein
MNARSEWMGVSKNDAAPHLPALVEQAGPAARFAFEEFFYGRIRNPYTRRAYLHAVRKFSAWCSLRGLELPRVTPADVRRQLDSLPVALPTRKLHLAALRRFFDELVLRHVVLLNPALSVRTERYQVVEGKTPEISIEHARRLLRSIDVEHVVGLRDRAVIAILIYMAARVGAVARLRVGDFYDSGDRDCLRFTERGGQDSGDSRPARPKRILMGIHPGRGVGSGRCRCAPFSHSRSEDQACHRIFAECQRSCSDVQTPCVRRGAVVTLVAPFDSRHGHHRPLGPTCFLGRRSSVLFEAA